MRILATLRDRYGFTKTELSVIAVLAATYATGSLVRWASGPRQAVDPPAFDYAEVDSVFASRSLLKPATVPGTRATGEVPAVRVDINRAGAAELQRLPGIGPKLAERIIAYRNEHGFFASVDDLVDVAGIGAKKLDRLRPFAEIR
jgi:competence ComEA-like helix-hairpin-helix protein